jgi:hypothetical protein
MSYTHPPAATNSTIQVVQQSPSSQHLVRPSSKALISNLLPRPFSGSAASACGHANAGQELCYLCHQRQRRNIPVYLHEEIKQKDKEESQLLSQYQQMKDMDKQLLDEEKANARRMDRARMDAFNLGVAEAIKEKMRERPKTSDLSVSFILPLYFLGLVNTNKKKEKIS